MKLSSGFVSHMVLNRTTAELEWHVHRKSHTRIKYPKQINLISRPTTFENESMMAAILRPIRYQRRVINLQFNAPGSDHLE